MKLKKATQLKFVALCCIQLFIFNTIFAQCNVGLVQVRAGTVSPLCDTTKLDWASWSSITGTLASGRISSDLTVTVTKPTGSLGQTGGMYAGTNFPVSYNVPINNPAIMNDVAGLFTFCYSKPVVNPIVAFSSIGNPSTPVNITTSDPYQVVWNGLSMSYTDCKSFTGTEGYTIIKFPGVHSCISFDYLNSEYYCNLAFGVIDSNCQATPPVPICVGSGDSNKLTAIASGGVPPYSYSWSPATGLSSTSGAVVTAAPSDSTLYIVSVTDNNGAFIGIDSILVPVYPKPNVTITHVCANDSVTLTASGGSMYHWVQNNSNAPSIKVSDHSNTNYMVIVTDDKGCTDTATTLVFPPPTASLSETCSHDSLQLKASGGGTYSWNPGNATSSTIKVSTNPSIKYIVTVMDNQGCTDTASIMVHPAPISAISQICENDTVKLTASGGGTYLWSPGNSISSILKVDPHSNLTYSVIVTNSQGCTDTSSTSIIPPPIASIAELCENDSLTLTASGGDTYVWNPGNINSASITVSPYIDKNYTVTVTNSIGCTDRATVEASQVCTRFNIPNVFSPNGDGKNDVFLIDEIGYSTFEIVIYDRWGLKVFESSNPLVSWNGKIDNSKGEASDGTYFYVCKVKDNKGTSSIHKGYLTLVR